MANDQWAYGELISAVARGIARADVFRNWKADEALRQARSEAEQLLCAAAKITILQLVTMLHEEVPTEVATRVLAQADDRQRGHPLAYILGQTYFYGRAFLTREGVLIPRPDTEILVETALQFIRGHVPTASVADIGTGSGCIAATVALECPTADVTGVDVSAAALSLAMENARRHGASVSFVEDDMRTWLPRIATSPGRFHAVISNPPYIRVEDMRHLDEGVRDHEPSLALDGGFDGLDFYRLFAQLCPNHLFYQGPAGLFLEVGDNQAASVMELFSHKSAWQSFHIDAVRDLRGVHRVVRIVRI